MKVSLEGFVPHPQSLRWRLADAYYEAASISAWTSGSVPYRATSNYATARQHALVVTALFVEMEATNALAADEPFAVLEVGSGLGQFAGNFLKALEADCGAGGRRLRARLCYLLSDRNPTTVAEATAQATLAPHVAAGRVVPALYDLRRPAELRRLDGAPLLIGADASCQSAGGRGDGAWGAPAATIANYVCCVSPPTVIRRRGATYEEQYTALAIESADDLPAEKLIADYLADPRASKLLSEVTVDSEWRAIDLARRWPSGPHAGAVAAALAGLDPATLLYPQEFVDFLVGFASVARPGALALVSDYGSSDRRDLLGEQEGGLQLYGNSHSHSVNFSLFDALARQAGWVSLRTRNPFRSVHGAALRFAATVANPFRSAYQRAFVRSERGEDLLDFRDTARGFAERKEYRNAARYYRRCLRLDRDNPQLLCAMGEVCLEAGYHEAAYRALRRGYRLVGPKDEYEFDFLLGRTCRALGRDAEAIDWYNVSLARLEHHVTLTNLAELYRLAGRAQHARDHLARAVALAPGYERAIKMLAEIDAAG